MKYTIVPMPAFEGYNVFGAYADKECIPYTTVRVESKFFNHVRFHDDIWNPVLILNGHRLYDIELWTITYKYKQQEYAVIAFTQILPQDKCGIIKQIVGDNEIYNIDTTYENFIKHSFFTEIVWQNSHNRRMYDAGYRIIHPNYVFEHFDEFDDDVKKRFNAVFQNEQSYATLPNGCSTSKSIKHTIQKANDRDKLRFSIKYIKSIIKLKKIHNYETC